MEKFLFDEGNGLWYELQGDYYIPCLTAPEVEQPVDLWRQRHLRFIREHRQGFYTALLLGGKLNSYLAEVDSRAGQMLNSLITRMAAGDGITEQLKAQDQMAWVQRMNVVQNAAEEIVNNEVIFV